MTSKCSQFTHQFWNLWEHLKWRKMSNIGFDSSVCWPDRNREPHSENIWDKTRTHKQQLKINSSECLKGSFSSIDCCSQFFFFFFLLVKLHSMYISVKVRNCCSREWWDIGIWSHQQSPDFKSTLEQPWSRQCMLKCHGSLRGLLLLDTGKLHALWDVMVLKLLHNDSNKRT